MPEMSRIVHNQGKPGSNSKSEARNSKQIEMSKKGNDPNRLTAIGGVFLEFRALRHSDLFRISNFVLRISIAPCR